MKDIKFRTLLAGEIEDKVDIAKLTYEDRDGFKVVINLFEMGGSAYCDKATYICSSSYYETYKFNLSDVDGVLRFITNDMCGSLDDYFEQIDGAELVLQENKK